MSQLLIKYCTYCKVEGEFAKGQTWCKACQKEYRKKNNSKNKEYLKKWHTDNPDYDRARYVSARFGITLKEYDDYFVGASCGMCGRESDLVLDHNREPHYIRGVLCATCNSGIGLLRDSAELCKQGEKWLKKGEKDNVTY